MLLTYEPTVGTDPLPVSPNSLEPVGSCPFPTAPWGRPGLSSTQPVGAEGAFLLEVTRGHRPPCGSRGPWWGLPSEASSVSCCQGQGQHSRRPGRPPPLSSAVWNLAVLHDSSMALHHVSMDKAFSIHYLTKIKFTGLRTGQRTS